MKAETEKRPVRVGDTIEIRCEGCREWFAWTVVEGWEAGTPSHHSRNCKQRHSGKRLKATQHVPCPHPHKRLFRGQATACAEMIHMAKTYREPFTVYRCVCGGLHIGRPAWRFAS